MRSLIVPIRWVGAGATTGGVTGVCATVAPVSTHTVKAGHPMLCMRRVYTLARRVVTRFPRVARQHALEHRAARIAVHVPADRVHARARADAVRGTGDHARPSFV